MRTFLKILLRKILAVVIYHSRLIHFLGKRKKEPVIFTYHRICNEEQEPGVSYVPGMSVKPGTFEKHLMYIKRHFKVVSLQRLISLLEAGKDIANHCVLTFDDGWRDNYENAYPILKKHGLPATIFLVTDFIGSNNYPWFEQVARILCNSRSSKQNPQLVNPSNHPCLQKIHFFDIISNSYSSDKERINTILQEMKKLTHSEISHVISEMSQYLNTPIASRSSVPLFLSWEQIIEMEKNGISFGSHTASHMILTTAREDYVRQQLNRSKEEIESKIGKSIATFCYPNGNFSFKVKEAVMEAGYRSATTSKKGFISARSDPLLLRRIGIHEDISSCVPLFACRAQGVPFF